MVRSTLLSTCLVMTADRSYFLIINIQCVKDKPPLIAILFFLITKPVKFPKVDLKKEKKKSKSKKVGVPIPISFSACLNPSFALNWRIIRHF